MTLMGRGTAALAVAAIASLSACGGDGRGALEVSGNIEVTQVEASFRVPGRVVGRPVDEGQKVSAGQLLARLDDVDFKHQVNLRQADADAAKAALARLLAGSRREEIAAAAAQVEQAKALLSRAQADDIRNTELLKKEVISPREYDASHSAFAAEQARLREAQEHYDLVKNGPRREDIDQARARLDAAEQALTIARTQFGYATLSSAQPGVVLSKNVEPGEFVAAGTPVVTTGDLSEVFLRAYINETDLGRVKVGQKADITTDSYPGKRYSGSITFIGQEAEFTPKTVQTAEERVKLVYRVKITVPNPSMDLKPGMPADGVIRTED